MAKQPYLNFFVGDWLRDTALMTNELCGVWINLLCHLHIQNPRGVIALDKAKLMILLKQNESNCFRLLDELIASGVADVEKLPGGGAKITSRRMIRETAKSEARSVAGKLGGAKTQQKIKNSLGFAKANDKSNIAANSGIGNGNGIDNDKGYEGGTGEEKDYSAGNGDDGNYYPDFGTPGQPVGLLPVSRCLADYLTDQYHEIRNTLACNYSLPLEVIDEWATVFARVLLGSGETDKTMSDFISHFSRWLNKQPNKREPEKYFKDGKDNRTGNGQAGNYAHERPRPASAAVLKRPGTN